MLLIWVITRTGEDEFGESLKAQLLFFHFLDLCFCWEGQKVEGLLGDWLGFRSGRYYDKHNLSTGYVVIALSKCVSRLQNRVKPSFKLHCFYICNPSVCKNTTQCQTSKWRLTGLNSTFADQLDLRNWASLCTLNCVLWVCHKCPAGRGRIQPCILPVFTQSFTKLQCLFSGIFLFYSSELFQVSFFLGEECFHTMMKTTPFPCNKNPALVQQCGTQGFTQLTAGLIRCT